MPDPQQALVSFFEQVARKDRALLEKLEQEPRFSMQPERWCFTLPGLHAFLQCQDETFSHLGYGPFRKLIFCSAINQTLQSCGAEITLHDNRSHVDKSTYALVWPARD